MILQNFGSLSIFLYLYKYLVYIIRIIKMFTTYFGEDFIQYISISFLKYLYSKYLGKHKYFLKYGYMCKVFYVYFLKIYFNSI